MRCVPDSRAWSFAAMRIVANDHVIPAEAAIA
jgi:hypothetical protein